MCLMARPGDKLIVSNTCHSHNRLCLWLCTRTAYLFTHRHTHSPGKARSKNTPHFLLRYLWSVCLPAYTHRYIKTGSSRGAHRQIGCRLLTRPTGLVEFLGDEDVRLSRQGSVEVLVHVDVVQVLLSLP